jgi:tetratricopeptide (TPR) repeat protein
VPTDARSFVARARMRGVFHRFAAALTDLDGAAALGGDRVELDAERAAIHQALGRYDEALAIRRAAVDGHADFTAAAALASLYGERGELDEAERWFSAATRSYRGTSPFPPALLELQRGKLWMEHDDLRRARAWCDAAVRRLGAYVPAQGHLAELDAALGETAAAIARLRPLALASDDPDYATQLARLLGDTEEAQIWRGKTEARYDELLVRHHDAFADHAAEFWLTVGGDPERALRLARRNLSLRQTPRARALVRRSERSVRSVPGRWPRVRRSEEANALVVAVDVARSWFRYHHLLADLVRLVLRREAPGEVAGLHRLAAGWHAEHGNAIDAIRHAQLGEDWELATELLGRHWVQLVLDGEEATLGSLLAGLPAHVADADSEVATITAADRLWESRWSDADALLQASEPAHARRRAAHVVLATAQRRDPRLDEQQPPVGVEDRLGNAQQPVIDGRRPARSHSGPRSRRSAARPRRTRGPRRRDGSPRGSCRARCATQTRAGAGSG